MKPFARTTSLMMLSAISVALLMMLANHFVLDQVRHEAVRQAGLQQERSLRTFWELINQKGTDFRVVDSSLYVGPHRLNGDNELTDRVYSITGSRATIFMNGTRIATCILFPDGRRAIGTPLLGPARDAVFGEGIPYRGETKILGIPYFTAYDPVRNAQGQVVGALFVGVRKSEYLANYEKMSLRIRAINGTLAAVFVLFAFLLLNERKRSEEEIRKQLDFLQVLSDTIPSPIFSRDAAGRYSGCNKAFQAFVGMTREEVVGKTVHEVWPRELADRYHQMDRELEQRDGEQLYEFQVKNADGTLHDVAFHRAAIRDARGGYAGLVGVMLDISERKAAEEELREAYHRTSDIIEFLPDGTFVVDAENRVIAWNGALERMTGMPKEEMLGGAPGAYSVPFHGEPGKMLIDLLDHPEEVQLRYDNGARDGSTIFGEIRIPNFRGGGERILRGAAAPLLDRQGKRVGGIQTVRDITELWRVTREKQQLAVQMHHSRMMESLLVQLSHDLKTPLTPLFALLPMVSRKVGDPQLVRMLEICQQGAGQIQGLADKALDLVRLSSRQSRPELVPVELKGSAQLALQAALPLLEKRGVNCRNLIDPGLLVLGAFEQLELLFQNLLSNAARYAALGGEVEISACCRDGSVQVAVRDDGEGLDPEHTGLIFHEFFKADAARHDLETQGLGLAICQRIVVNHGGRIWAQSRGKGRGTTIFFTLKPAADGREGTLP